MAFPKPIVGESKEYTLCPEGAYQGVLAQAYYVGHHRSKHPQYKDKPPVKTIVLYFEIDEPDELGKNRILSTTLTLSTGENANLTQLLRPWLGTRFPKIGQPLDLPALVGSMALVTVAHQPSKDKIYANIKGLAPLPRGMAPFEPQLKQFAWALGETYSEDTPKYIIDKAESSVEKTGDMYSSTDPVKPAQKEANRVASALVGAATTAEPVSDEDDYPF